MNYPLVEKYGKQVRWLNWKLETVNDKFTKVPYCSKNQKASSVDSKTWSTYEEASTQLDNGANGFSGIGIVLHDNKLVCIDIDHVVESGKVVSPHSEEILKLLKLANSFTEISQSGTGIHIYIDLTFSFTPIANKKAPYEVYSTSRYIAVTNNSYDKVPKEVRTIDNENELISILSVIGYPWGKDKKNSQSVQVHDVLLSDEEILSVMFSAKNGVDMKKLYEGDTSKFDDDESRADMALLSSLAFYTQKNAHQMESLWKSSPLGQRKKTQERQDYRERSIQNAIDNCKTVYTRHVKATKNIEFLTHTVKKEGKLVDIVIPCKENVLIAMRTTPGIWGKVRHNLWTDRMEVFDTDGKWRNAIDNDINLVRSVLSNNYRDIALVAASERHVRDALQQYAYENAVDPAIDFFKSLVWDGKPRIDTFIKNAYNTVGHETAYASFGRQWLKGLVSRVMLPGCKFDYVLVLEGPQGLRKSMSFYKLTAPEWHNEITSNPNDKDFFMMMKGKMIVEFSEGETHDRASSKLMKSIITRTIDTYRNPYGYFTNDNYRRCVFSMSVNDLKYLRDETGNRRYLPVKCGNSINIEWIVENREQLFAEAYHYAITLSENLYDGLSTDEVREMQEERRQERFEETRIISWYEDLSKTEREEGHTLEEIFDMAIAKEGDRFNQLHNNILPPILTNVLKLQQVRRLKDGKRRTLYIPSEETYKKFPSVALF